MDMDAGVMEALVQRAYRAYAEWLLVRGWAELQEEEREGWRQAVAVVIEERARYAPEAEY